MKSLLFFVLMAFGLFAQAENLVIEGKDPAGQPCSLTIESAVFEGEPVFANLVMTVRTNWLRPENPSLIARRSFTPGWLYGINKETKDQVSIAFDDSSTDPAAIQSFLFESHGPLLQAHCRIH